MVLRQIYLDEESETVFGRYFSGRSLTILKNGIYKYPNIKLVKQNDLLVLFSVLCHQIEAKISSSPNYFLFLKFGNNTGLRLKLVVLVYSYVEEKNSITASKETISSTF